ncbi:MAG: enoyl-CoA hydratase-related protein [Wenzhouxiangellaceae bacterium]|nr:enoyl-CoA hydratase-related protein [Wenzhouxiangellaceae bacterium]
MPEQLTFTTDARGVAWLELNRPQVHNAFNADLIERLSRQLDELTAEVPRALIITGVGKSFSAGADLDWMRSMADAGEAENRADSERLAAMFRKLDELPCPTIARVNGAAFGGGAGLVSCCDIAIADANAQFGLTEVRLGLIPATIAPFVLARIGTGNARRYMLTGERFDAAEAQRIGLLHEICPTDELDRRIDSMIDSVLSSAPGAVDQCKQLIRRVQTFEGGASELDAITAEWIARLRVSEEGQSGLRAFLEKRKPDWVLEKQR